MRLSIAALTLAAALAACQTPPQTPPPAPAQEVVRSEVAFNCENGTTFTAAFISSPDVVDLHFANGDVIRLPIAISGSGYRYTDGKHELRGKADEAMYTIGRMVPTKCYVSK
ncbi:MAG TPA: MliC family protein [Caulobacterales bacterium]|jgi:membrane-bound inhibitor of C-type lysozyme|nr:MliC family protein [Caulobacterales bacterium]